MTGRLHVDRVELRVRGVSPRSAQRLGAELGGALQRVLEQELRRRPAGRGRVARITAPPVTVRSGRPPQETATAVARAVADGMGGRGGGTEP